jgi:hypothetical protein
MREKFSENSICLLTILLTVLHAARLSQSQAACRESGVYRDDFRLF